ncbi:BamA/TamA family outer membrane protein [Pendulispora rubella]|uniref:BamA/TamA family outer membrane protein n=1 Tax=Pendulispora rubella TaxID=2741070 RepID=A0ABZ2KY80_9BACT
MKRLLSAVAIGLAALAAGHGEASAQDSPPQPLPTPPSKPTSPAPEGKPASGEKKADTKDEGKPKDDAKPKGDKKIPVSYQSPKRPLPDYDGRGDDPATAGDVALWVPRLLFSPLYFTSEYLIRRPLGALITGAERAGLPEALYDFFTFGPDHNAGFLPIGFVDFGFNPSVGIFLFWRDAFFKGNEFQIHGTTWGTDWVAAQFVDRITFHNRDTLTLSAGGIRRPDHAFFGIGARSLQGDRSRYGRDQVDVNAMVDLHLWRASRLEAGMGLKTVEIYNGHFGGDPNIDQGAAQGRFAIPYGFDRGYTAEYNTLTAALDTRQPRPAPGSGIRIELTALQGNDVRRSPGSGWVKYGGTVGGFYDLNDRGRVVSLSLNTQFADPLGGRDIPFLELVSLGGPNPMRGFFPGRLLGRSAAVVTARYRWPIWIWLDGSIQAAVGNVFDEHLKDFKPSLLRFSGAIGVESVGSPDSSFELLVGLGSETFEHGGQLNSFRLSVGSNRGF